MFVLVTSNLYTREHSNKEEVINKCIQLIDWNQWGLRAAVEMGLVSVYSGTSSSHAA